MPDCNVKHANTASMGDVGKGEGNLKYLSHMHRNLVAKQRQYLPLEVKTDQMQLSDDEFNKVVYKKKSQQNGIKNAHHV